MTESVLIRTYELFDVEWETTDESGTYRSRWTGYDTAEEAQRVADSGARISAEHGIRRSGTVVRRTWDTIIPADMVDVYRPGCAERVEIVEVG